MTDLNAALDGSAPDQVESMDHCRCCSNWTAQSKFDQDVFGTRSPYSSSSTGGGG